MSLLFILQKQLQNTAYWPKEQKINTNKIEEFIYNVFLWASISSTEAELPLWLYSNKSRSILCMWLIVKLYPNDRTKTIIIVQKAFLNNFFCIDAQLLWIFLRHTLIWGRNMHIKVPIQISNPSQLRDDGSIIK